MRNYLPEILLFAAIAFVVGSCSLIEKRESEGSARREEDCKWVTFGKGIILRDGDKFYCATSYSEVE